jgi:hypothetical protein
VGGARARGGGVSTGGPGRGRRQVVARRARAGQLARLPPKGRAPAERRVALQLVILCADPLALRAAVDPGVGVVLGRGSGLGERLWGRARGRGAGEGRAGVGGTWRRRGRARGRRGGRRAVCWRFARPRPPRRSPEGPPGGRRPPRGRLRGPSWMFGAAGRVGIGALGLRGLVDVPGWPGLAKRGQASRGVRECMWMSERMIYGRAGAARGRNGGIRRRAK